MNARVRGFLLAALLAVAGFAWWSWPLASHLATHTLVLREDPELTDADRAARADWNLIVANDQDLSLWGAMDNARTLLRGDFGGLMTQGQCWPMPEATALGEHMFEVGVLAAPWWLATGEPVAAYDLSLMTAVLVAATGMFLFLQRHVASMPAALAGAMAFAFAAPRLVDLPYHPAVIGTHWLPWVLWAFDGIVAGAGIAGVAVFSVTLLLASVTGSYPLMAVGIVGASYGATTLALLARRSGARAAIAAAARSLAGLLPVALVVGAMLATYAGVQQQWAIPTNPDTKFLVTVSDYLPGFAAVAGFGTAAMSVGIVSLVGLAGLLAEPVEDDPEEDGGTVGTAPVALGVAALVAILMTTRLPLPGGPWSVYEELCRHVALLDAVRAPGKAALAAVFALQALGAIGWGRVLQEFPPRVSLALAAVLVALTLVEASPPLALRGLLGDGAAMQLREVAPARAHLDTLRAALPTTGEAGRRAVLDLPTGRMVKAPLALLDAAWHGHPTSACYNSLIPPTMREVYAMAARSHGRRGVEELAAAGFGYVLERPSSPSRPLSSSSFPEPAQLVAFDPGLAVWALPEAPPLHHDRSLLALAVKGGATRASLFAPLPPHELDVEVTNHGEKMWAAPRPLVPLVADVQLRSPGGTLVVETKAHGLLPLALSPGASTTVQLTMPLAPSAGRWRATIRIEGFPDAVVPAELEWASDGR